MLVIVRPYWPSPRPVVKTLVGVEAASLPSAPTTTPVVELALFLAIAELVPYCANVSGLPMMIV